MRDYRKIRARQLADDLTVSIYAHSRTFPREEIYGLTSQLRRAGYSVPSNIAEGSARSSKKDYLHFLYIARGSLAEACYFLHLAHRLDYLEKSAYHSLEAQAGEASACLYGLIRAVESEAGRAGRIAAKVTSGLMLILTQITGHIVQN